ncbi:MAG TPA: hypothetical protein VK842_08060, partial [bacterium]|nr:hypothetical protein [bacterium]
HHQLAAGVDPAWDQSVLCGAPRFDESLSACLYPPLRWVLGLWDGCRAVGVYQAVHMAWAGWGAYLWTRSRGLAAEACLLGALCAAVGGGLVYYEYAWPVFTSISWFPWMLLGLALVQDRPPSRRWAGAGILGASVGLAFLGGHPGMSFYELLALAVLHLAWLGVPGPDRRVAGAWLALAAAALVAACIYGGQALAIRRASAQSVRGEALTPEQCAETSLSPAALGEVLLPHALGRRPDDSFLGVSWRFGTYEPQGLLCYLGLAALLLAGLGFQARPKELWPLGLAWGLLLAYALGRWDPAYAWLCRLPVLDHLRAPDKAVGVGGCLAALPVAVGAQSLWASRRRGPALLALGFGLALAALAGLLRLAMPRLQALGHAHIQQSLLGDALHHQSAAYYEGRLLRWILNLHGHLLSQAAWSAAAAVGLVLLAEAPVRRRWPALLLALLLFGDLAWNGRAYLAYIDDGYYSHVPGVVAELRQRADPAAPARTFTWGYEAAVRRAFPQGRFEGDLAGEERLEEALKANLNRNYDLDTADGYSALWLSRMQPLLGWVDDGNPFEDPAASGRVLAEHRRALDLAAVRWVASAVPLDLPGLRLAEPGPEWLYENSRALPMAYIATRSSGGWTAATAWEKLRDPRSPEASWDRPALLEDASAPATGQGRVAWKSYHDERWELSADVQGAGGVLVLSRIYYPGPWQALVNGAPAQLVPVNAAFCALHLGPGWHQVSVAYVDPLLALARAGLWLGLLLALGLVLAGWRRREVPA